MRTLLLLALLGDRPPVECSEASGVYVCKSTSGYMSRYYKVEWLSDGGFLYLPQFHWKPLYAETRMDWKWFRCGSDGDFFSEPNDAGYGLAVGCKISVICNSFHSPNPRLEYRDSGTWLVCDFRDGGQ